MYLQYVSRNELQDVAPSHADPAAVLWPAECAAAPITQLAPGPKCTDSRVEAHCSPHTRCTAAPVGFYAA